MKKILFTICSLLIFIAGKTTAQTDNTKRDVSFTYDFSAVSGFLTHYEGDWLTGKFRNSVKALSDGKSLVYGILRDQHHNEISGIARVNLDGSWDQSFKGPNASNDYNLRVYDVLELSGGKYMIVGSFTDKTYGSQQTSILLLNNDGSIDPSFEFEYNTVIEAIVMLPDGKFLIGNGSNHLTDFKKPIYRLNADGTIDNTFDLGEHYPDPGSVKDIHLLPNGKIVVNGPFSNWTPLYDNPTVNQGVAILNADGSYDDSFSYFGSFKSNMIEAYPRVAVATDGSIIVAGLDPESSNQYLIKRYNPDLSLDDDFYSPSVEPRNGQYPTRVLIQPDGKILIAGHFLYQYDNNPNISGIFRLNPDGTVDNTFDTESGFGNSSDIYDIALQADGKILVLHTSPEYQEEGLNITNGFPTHQHIIRLNGDEGGGSASIAEKTIPVFDVYPNPANELVNITNLPQNATIIIHDMMGRVMLNKAATDYHESINISHLPSGMYLITVASAGKQRVKKLNVR